MTMDMGLHVNPLIRVNFRQGLELQLPLEGTTFALDDPAILTALSLLRDASTVDDLAKRILDADLVGDIDAAGRLVTELERVGVIQAGPPNPLWRHAERWIERGWTEALLFHLACHTDRFVDEATDDLDDVNDQRLAEPAATRPVQTWHRYPGPTVDLPAGLAPEALPDLETVLMRRRSNRPWQRTTITLAEVATIARLASAETVEVRRTFERNIDEHPSAMLNSPFTSLELYLVAHAVEGIEPGLYHVEPDTNRLCLVRAGDMRTDMQRMCVGQHRAGSGSASWIVTTVWERYMWRYPQPSAYRSLIMNAGELAQKLIVYSTALGLSTFLTPAFDDDFADELLGFEPTIEAPLEVIGIG